MISWIWLWAILLGLGVGLIIGMIVTSGFSVTSDSTSRFLGSFFGSLFGILGAASLYFLKEHRDRARVEAGLAHIFRRSKVMFDRINEDNLPTNRIAVRVVRYLQYVRNFREYCKNHQFEHYDMGELFWIFDGIVPDIDSTEKVARETINSGDEKKAKSLIEMSKTINTAMETLQELRRAALYSRAGE